MANGNAKNFELKIGKTGLMIIVAGMTALLCAAFLFGVDVGENMDVYPQKIASIPQRALALVWRPAKIKMAQNTPDNKAAQNQAGGVQESHAALPDENIDLTFYNKLTGKKGSPDEELSMEKNQAGLPSKNEEEAQKGKFNIETTKQPAATNVKSIEKEVNKEAQSVPNANSQKNKFTVQAASLKDKDKARQINKKISALGFKSEIIKTEIKGKGTTFRVIATGFSDKAKAEEASKKISSKTGTKCIIRVSDNKAQ